MAKINYHKSKVKITNGGEIKSIVGEDCLKDFESRKQKKRELAQKDHETLINAKQSDNS